MSGILVYALHSDEGEFNNNSLGAISEAAKLAGEVGGEAAALVVGDVDDAAAAGLGNYGAAKVYRDKSVPEGLAQPIVDAMAKVMSDESFSYALFGGGLLGFEIGAGLTARLGAGVTMEVTAVKADGGKLVADHLCHRVDDRLGEPLGNGPRSEDALGTVVAETGRGVIGDVAHHKGRGLGTQLSRQLRRLGDGAERVLVEVALVVVEGVDQDPRHQWLLSLVRLGSGRENRAGRGRRERGVLEKHASDRERCPAMICREPERG